MVNPMPYLEIHKLMEMEGGPAQEVALSMFLDTFDRSVAEKVVKHLQAASAPVTVAQFRVLGGVMARIPNEATAFAHRDQRFMAAPGAVYKDAADTPRHEDWLKAFAAALDQDQAGFYVNFVGSEREARVHEAYPGAMWARLAAIKVQYDPDNLFRRNHNIPPAGPQPSARPK